MKQQFYSLKNQLIAIVGLFLSFSSLAQGIPFNCDYSAYLFQYNDVYAIDLASGSSFLAASDITTGDINATGYNSADGYIWGSLSSPSKSIVRIGKNFETTTYYIPELPAGNRYIGDVSLDGIYYLKSGGTTYYTIDLDPASANYTKYISTENLSQSISIHDWAFNAVDDYLYSVEKNTNILYRIDPSNGNVLALGEVPILSGLNYTYGAVYFDVSGRFYISANQTGTIYVIQSVQDLDGTNAISSNLFAFGPSSASNDGARCPTAPVAQEICDNGIDDDGDGLIDCQDPSCSGYGNCEVLDPGASGGNEGGLESNNRLADAIAKRNYDRAKTNYTFNKTTAPRVKKREAYGVKNKSFVISLQDFIPLNEIDEDYVIESTPLDLLNITNATEVYAVDYIKNEVSQASILALKTENGVYEHTKYICDRLFGAELISVSTIEINEQHFIKSLIRNIDGSVEFVLSLSAKAVNGESEFAIESHWNLNEYEANVTFYNFQIWASSVDDLHRLGQGVLDLLEVEKPISTYEITNPPTVFVKKGSYANGSLSLQIVNTNATESVVFDAGLRTTETSILENMTTTIDLNGNYLTDVMLPTGHLFDIGFRIGDGIATPDDLFLSDGPWGVDDAKNDTTVLSYDVTTNSNVFEPNTLPVERNVELAATTSSYVAVYRALTPRFQAVDVSAYNMLQLRGAGTGSLEITLAQKSIENWEDQYKASLVLTENMQDFNLPFDNFTNPSGNALILDNLVTIVFTMVSENGTVQTKEMKLQDVHFINSEILATETFSAKKQSALSNYPNPFSNATTIQLNEAITNVRITVVDMLGRIVDSQELNTQNSGLIASYVAPELPAGIYSYLIVNDAARVFRGKFMIK